MLGVTCLCRWFCYGGVLVICTLWCPCSLGCGGVGEIVVTHNLFKGHVLLCVGQKLMSIGHKSSCIGHKSIEIGHRSICVHISHFIDHMSYYIFHRLMSTFHISIFAVIDQISHVFVHWSIGNRSKRIDYRLLDQYYR